MSIKTINIFLNQKDKKISVGRLASKDEVIYFEYDKEFLNSKLELSPYKVPLRPGVLICDDNVFEGLFGLFGDSLPDGWGRLLLDRHFLNNGVNYSDITPLDRLSYIGKYGIGALSYEPIIDDIQCTTLKDIVLDELAEASHEILQGESEKLLDELILIGGSSAGARPKVMIQLSDDKKSIIHGAQTLNEGYEHWMVKFASSHDSEDIAKVEYAYSLMAKDASVAMSETTLLSSNKSSYFATKRFDRDADNRIHIHSVAGLTHSDFRFPTLDYDDLLGLALHLTKDVNEQLKMFRLAVFNLLTHNRDDHAKNFSFLMKEDGGWKLSPAYDLTFSYGPRGEHSTTYLGNGKHPTSEILMKLAKKHNINNAATIIQEIKEVVNNFKFYADSVNLKKSSYDRINKALSQHNDIPQNYKDRIAIKEKEILQNMQKNFHITFKVPLIITDKFKGRLFGLTSYDHSDIKIYLNKNVMQESINYIIDSVIAHEYAHALLFKQGNYNSKDDGHSELWRRTCQKLGGKDCQQYVNHQEIIISKMPFN
jgi:serine/threonine-protein kinase HipA